LSSRRSFLGLGVFGGGRVARQVRAGCLAHNRLRFEDHYLGCPRCSEPLQFMDQNHATSFPRQRRHPCTFHPVSKASLILPGARHVRRCSAGPCRVVMHDPASAAHPKGPPKSAPKRKNQDPLKRPDRFGFLNHRAFRLPLAPARRHADYGTAQQHEGCRFRNSAGAP